MSTRETALGPQPPRAPARPEPTSPDPHRGLRRLLLAFVPLVVAFYAVQVRAIDAAAVVADLDIQLTLSRLTGQGAIPLIDFEHGWNTAHWYLSAALLDLAGGNTTLWLFLYGRVLGFMVAGFALLAIAWRLRLPTMWAAILVPAWLLLTHVPNGKYAVPLLWALTLLPVGRTARPGVAQALRIGMVATMWWFHIELAVLLGAGTALHDLFGARALPLAERLRRVGAIAAGGLIGLVTQAAVYAGLGLGPVALVEQVLFGQGEVDRANFGYPLLAPGSIRQLLFPASVVLPFVPVLWRRLSDPVRLLAFLHLGMALIGIRRTDFNHVAASTTLLAPLVVLGIRDVLDDERLRGRLAAWRAVPVAQRVAAGIVGGVWAVAAILAGYRFESRLAIVALSLVCLLGVAASWRGERAWASAGAVLALGGLLVAGIVGHAAGEVRADAADEAGRDVVEAVADDLDGCLGPDRQLWIVPGPGGLYAQLDVVNPTVHYAFWYTLEAEADRVIADLDDVPAILQVGGWPRAMLPVVPAIEAAYDRCADVQADGRRVVVWTRR